MKTSKVKMHDRIVTGVHFAHNKFIVFCKNGKPYKVWTGSTNTTENGLYTQVNNAVMNQDPGGKVHPLIFIHKGNQESTNYDTLMPKSVNEEFAYWSDEIKPKMVTIHSKVVIVDPFGKNPVVMTGSHNMGNKASASNDDNLNIIQGNAELDFMLGGRGKPGVLKPPVLKPASGNGKHVAK